MVTAHITCLTLSYAAFLVAFVTGLLFLVQERQLKRKQMGVLFRRLPALESLDRINFIAIGAGFGLLSAGVASGFVDAGLLRGKWWTGDPGEWLMLIVWAGYCALWIVRLRATLRGHRVALLSMLGFGLILLTFLGVKGLLPTWHTLV